MSMQHPDAAPANLARALALVLALAATMPVTALPGDNEQPINIQADRATYHAEKEIERTVYSGKVQITQGSLKINADQVSILIENREVKELLAVGKPARFQQSSDPGKAPTIAKARRIQYQRQEETVTLLENASLQQDNSTLTGERIDYNVATEKVTAHGADDGARPVNIVLEPGTAKPTAADSVNIPAVNNSSAEPAAASPSQPSTEGSANGDPASL